MQYILEKYKQIKIDEKENQQIKMLLSEQIKLMNLNDLE